MESVRPPNSKSNPHSPPPLRPRVPSSLRAHPSPALVGREEAKPTLERKAEDLHSLLLRDVGSTPSSELSRLRRREVELMKTLLEMKQVIVKQAQALCSVKRENHRLKQQLAQTQRLISENEEVLLAIQLANLEGQPEEVDVDRMTYEEILALEEEIGSVNTGLSQRNLETLQTRRVDWEMKEEAPVCSVCMNDHQLDDLAVVLPQCGHIYHKPCIDQWLANKNRCPVCQTAVVVT